MKLWRKVVTCCLGLLTLLMLNGASIAVIAAEEPKKPVEVAPITDEDLELSLKYGTRIVIPEGTEYYASADGFGSGSSNTVGSQFAPMGADAYVGGFALLDSDGRLIEYRGYIPEEIPIAETWQNSIEEFSWDQVWVGFFIHADNYDVADDSLTGWVPARSIAVINGIIGDGGSNAEYQSVKVVPKLEEDVPPAEGEENPEETKPENQESQDSGLDLDDLKSKLESSIPKDLDPKGIRLKLKNLIPRDPNSTDLSADVIDYVLPDPGNMIEDRVIQGRDTSDDENPDNTAFVSTREIAYAIEDYADNGEKVALLLDGSRSVEEYMSAIAVYGEYVDKVNKADIIITFGRDHMVIRAEEYLDAPIDRGKTNIYTPLNSLVDVSSYDRIILVTDTYHNVYSELNAENFEEFDGKIVIVSPIKLSKVKKGVISEIEDAFGTTVYLCLLDNELDRIQALEIISPKK